MSSRRAWCQSRLNSSCSRASSSVRLNISLRRWTPRTVCTARLGRPLSTQYMGAKRSSSIRGSASFRKTSAQLLSRRLAFFGVTRNWDCQRLSCGSRIRNILPSLGQAQRPRPFITLSPPCPRLARGFYEQIRVDCAINIASMQEMNEFSIASYFMFLRRSTTPSSRFYCVNRLRKDLPGGEVTSFKDYPWQEDDEVFIDGPCPYYAHFFGHPMLPKGPRVLGVRVPFVNYFDGIMMHRLARLAPL